MCRLGLPLDVLIYQTGSRCRAARETERERGAAWASEESSWFPRLMASPTEWSWAFSLVPTVHVRFSLLLGFQEPKTLGRIAAGRRRLRIEVRAFHIEGFPSLFWRFLPTPSWKSLSTVKISIPGGAVCWCCKAGRFQWFSCGIWWGAIFRPWVPQDWADHRRKRCGCVQSASAVGPQKSWARHPRDCALEEEILLHTSTCSGWCSPRAAVGIDISEGFHDLVVFAIEEACDACDTLLKSRAILKRQDDS